MAHTTIQTSSNACRAMKLVSHAAVLANIIASNAFWGIRRKTNYALKSSALLVHIKKEIDAISATVDALCAMVHHQNNATNAHQSSHYKATPVYHVQRLMTDSIIAPKQRVAMKNVGMGKICCQSNVMMAIAYQEMDAPVNALLSEAGIVVEEMLHRRIHAFISINPDIWQN